MKDRFECPLEAGNRAFYKEEIPTRIATLNGIIEEVKRNPKPKGRK